MLRKLLNQRLPASSTFAAQVGRSFLAVDCSSMYRVIFLSSWFSVTSSCLVRAVPTASSAEPRRAIASRQRRSPSRVASTSTRRRSSVPGMRLSQPFFSMLSSRPVTPAFETPISWASSPGDARPGTSRIISACRVSYSKSWRPTRAMASLLVVLNHLPMAPIRTVIASMSSSNPLSRTQWSRHRSTCRSAASLVTSSILTTVSLTNISLANNIGHAYSVADHPLRHAPFRWLVTGTTVNLLGSGIAPVALAFAVLDLGGGAAELGLVVGLYALADVGAVLFGGVLGDRFSRTVMLQGSAAAAAVAQGLVALSLIGDWSSIPLLAVLGMANGCLGALGSPSSSAITQQTVPHGCSR